MDWSRARVETHDVEVFAGIKVKGLSLRSVFEDKLEQVGMSHSAEVASIEAMKANQMGPDKGREGRENYER